MKRHQHRPTRDWNTKGPNQIVTNHSVKLPNTYYGTVAINGTHNYQSNHKSSIASTIIDTPYYYSTPDTGHHNSSCDTGTCHSGHHC